MKSPLASFQFLNGLGTSLLPYVSRMNVIPLLQTKTADSAHTGIFASPFSNHWVEPGDKASTSLQQETWGCLSTKNEKKKQPVIKPLLT